MTSSAIIIIDGKIVNKLTEYKGVNGAKYATFNVATSDRYKTENGIFKNYSTMFKIISFQAQMFPYLEPGRYVRIVGKLKVSSYKNSKYQTSFELSVYTYEIYLHPTNVYKEEDKTQSKIRKKLEEQVTTEKNSTDIKAEENTPDNFKEDEFKF